ncbi:unnamed protein product, partial [Notodromas monacha]
MQVFVTYPSEPASTFSSLSVFEVDLLHGKEEIESVFETRRQLALGIAKQFASCLFGISSWQDLWVIEGMANYVVGLYLKFTFTSAHYFDWIRTENDLVVQYQKEHDGIVLDERPLKEFRLRLLSQKERKRPPDFYETWKSIDASDSEQSEADEPPSFTRMQKPMTYLDLQDPQTCSATFLKMYIRKAHLVFRLLEKELGEKPLRDTLISLFNSAKSVVERMLHPDEPECYLESGEVLISTRCLMNAARIHQMTRNSVQMFFEKWVFAPGHVQLHISYSFCKQTQCLTLVFKQPCCGHSLSGKCFPFEGYVDIWVQEVEKFSKETFFISDSHVSVSIPATLKSRKAKKRKGLIMWTMQLRYDRDYLTNLDAMKVLETRPSVQSRNALGAILADNLLYHKARIQAAIALARVVSKLGIIFSDIRDFEVTSIYLQMFGHKVDPSVVCSNDFQDIEHFSLKKNLPFAIAKLRNHNGICPPNVVRGTAFDSRLRNLLLDIWRSLYGTEIPEPWLTDTEDVSIGHHERIAGELECGDDGNGCMKDKTCDVENKIAKVTCDDCVKREVIEVFEKAEAHVVTWQARHDIIVPEVVNSVVPDSQIPGNVVEQNTNQPEVIPESLSSKWRDKTCKKCNKKEDDCMCIPTSSTEQIIFQDFLKC